MTSLLEKIDLKYRRAFYFLPLFVHWIIGMAWEKDESAQKAARRSMILTFLFLTGIGLLYFTHLFVTALFPDSTWHMQYVAFVVHAVLAVCFILISFLLAYREFVDKSLQWGLLDRFTARFETLAGF